VYEITKRKKPVIIIAADPKDYAKKFRAIHNESVLEEIYNLYTEKISDDTNLLELINNTAEDTSIEVKSHYMFLVSTYHRVYLTWYKFIQDEFKISHKNQELLNWLYEKANNNIARCYFTEMYVLVLRMPKYIKRNSVGFHNVDGPAIEWENYGMYYINGRKLSNSIFNAVINKTYKFDDFISEKNEDTKASVITLITEKFGNEELLKFLNASIINEQEIKHTSGHNEIVRIWKTKNRYSFISDINGNMNQPYAWLELKCPTSGSTYLIPTSSHFNDAVECCKFHRPQQIPMELKYDFKSFNN
jgi:hypothetical protein